MKFRPDTAGVEMGELGLRSSTRDCAADVSAADVSMCLHILPGLHAGLA